MKSLIYTLFLSISFSVVFAAEVKMPSDTGEIVIGYSHALLSENGETYEVNIYLPRSYGKETSQQYPVVYLIDGGKDQDFHHIAGLADLASVNPYLYREFIVVGIQTKNRLFELTSINTDQRYNRAQGVLGGSDEFREFLKSKVIPYSEKSLRTNGRRIVIGESLAGLFIAETLLKTPELFTDYVSVSPSMWYDDRSLSKNASKHMATHADKVRHLYIAMANEGGTMQKGVDELMVAIKKSKLRNLKVKYQDNSKSEFHWSIYHGEAMAALGWLLPAKKPEFADEPDPWYLVEGANPPNWNSSVNQKAGAKH